MSPFHNLAWAPLQETASLFTRCIRVARYLPSDSVVHSNTYGWVFHEHVRLDHDDICLPRVNPAAIHNKDNVICSFVSERSPRGWYDD